jgi:hypothetical protein
MKALLLHVGIDSTNVGISAPIFEKGVFEFIPIPESSAADDYLVKDANGSISVEALSGQRSQDVPWVRCDDARAYSDIPAHSTIEAGQHRTFLKNYVPVSFANVVVHYDPDMYHSTYGDRTDDSKGKQLPDLDPEDLLVFVASLAPYDEQAYSGERTKGRIAKFQRHRMAKYLVGYLRVRQVYRVRFDTNDFKEDFSSVVRVFSKDETSDCPSEATQITDTMSESTMEQISKSAHSKRDQDDYYIVVGSKESKRLPFAVKITDDGAPFKPNDKGRKIFDKGFPRGWKWIRNEHRLVSLLGFLEA